MTIGLDIGSSSVKAVQIDGRGGARRIVRRPLVTRRRGRDRVEQDGEQILRATIEALRHLAAGSPDGGPALGLATQRSTVLFWDRDDGRPLTPAFSWQDLRGARLCSALRRRSGRRSARGRTLASGDIDEEVAARTGLRLSPHYSASKIAWALDHLASLRRRVAAGRALWGTLGSFLLWRLSHGAVYAIDHANAQRTCLFGLAGFSWDPDLFDLFGLEALHDAPVLPALVPTFLSAGVSIDAAGRELRLEAQTGDQQAALVGLGCARAGGIAINYGSGAFVLMNVGPAPIRSPGLLTTLVASWRDRRQAAGASALYAVEGTVNAAATAIDWASRRLGLRVHTADLDRVLGPDDGRPRTVHFLPAIAGLGAPRWEPSARPRFAGEIDRADRPRLLRAVVESIAYRCAEIVRAAEAGRRGPRDRSAVLVAGGLTRCRALLQAQADLLGRPVVVRSSPDASGLGAALMARAGTRGTLFRRGGASAAARPGDAVVRPRISPDESDMRFRCWAEAVYGRD